MAKNSNTPTHFANNSSPSTDEMAFKGDTSKNRLITDNAYLSNNDHELPNYETFCAAPSAPSINDLPPNYFDISAVPDGAILYYQHAPPLTEPSRAVIDRKKKGVLSFDELIDHNPDQLWIYFLTYLNEKPRLNINICGSYTETYTTTETYQDSEGNTQTRSVTQTRTVTDFSFDVDVSDYICNQWWRIAVIPSCDAQRAGEIVTFRTALEQYTLSKKKIKDIVLDKQLHGWNLTELRDKLIYLVRSTGYQNDISVNFKTSNYQIAARSSSQLSRFSNSTVVRVLCCLTCLCIIFAPIYFCLRSAGSVRDKIAADYVFIKPSDTFLHLNANMIVSAVINRSFQSYMANF